MAVPTFTDAFSQPDPIACYSDQVFSLAPALYLRLGDAFGSGTAADSSGYGNAFTVDGTSGVTFGETGLLSGDSDTACQFGVGTSGWLSATGAQEAGGNPGAGHWLPTTAVTVAFWMNPFALPGLGSNNFIMAWTSSGAYWQLGLVGGHTQTDIIYEYTDSAEVGAIVEIPAGITAASTYFVVLTDTGASAGNAAGISLYINGVLVSTVSRPAGAGGFWADTYTAYVANDGIGDTYVGTLDEVAVFPDIVVTADQVAQLYAARTVITPVAWTALTGRGGAVSWSRGKQHELDQIQTGTATAQLRNIDRALDPTNTASVYYPNIKPMRRYRRQATINSTTYTCFSGFVSQWPQARTGPTYAEVPLQAVDGLELLNQTIISGSYPAELSGARVTRVLNLCGWAHADRSIDTGASTVQAVTYAATDQQTALNHIQTVVEQSERGLFFIAGNGQATFIDRHGLLTSPYNVSQATFSDKPGVGEFPYQTITPSFDRDLIYNDWSDTRTGGTLQEASDAPSIQSYFQRSQSITSLLNSDADSAGMVAYMLSQYKDAYFRVDEITLHPGEDTAFWQAILAREIGDRITVKESPPGGGAQIVKDFLIAQMSVNVPLHAADTMFTWQLLSVEPMNFLVLDDATRGQLDSNKIAW